MKLIFGFTTRMQMFRLGENISGTCRDCNRCTAVLIMPDKPFMNVYIQSDETVYFCEYHQTEVDIWTSEDEEIPCTAFKPLNYKKL